MQREIPGYYYDEAKQKYFKIEKSNSAPSSAAWSSDAVKRRRIEDAAQSEARRREDAIRAHVRRHRASGDVLTSGLLARDMGLRPVAEQGRGRADDVDLGAEAWARGVVAKGSVSFAPNHSYAAQSRAANMACCYVGAEDTKTGLGVAYATLDEATLVGSHIPTDANDRIRYERDAHSTTGRSRVFRTEMIRCPQMSSIKYHRPSHRILLTSREPDRSCGLYFFSPPLSDATDLDRPHWLLGETNHYQRLSITRNSSHEEWIVHSSTPAPASSDLICVIGTNTGILQVRPNERIMTLAPYKPAKGVQVPREMFAQDFLHGNHNVLFAGGRQPRLWMSDLRAPETQWSFTKHASSIAHLRSVNPHQVLVSGLQSSMALYDIRFFGRAANGAAPLLRFPGHKNEAHFQLGWDVDPGLGVVAAAQDNGTVCLFSLRSGCRLRSSLVDGIRSETPIKALMFQTMPRERRPSLFVGLGTSLQKYSFGTNNMSEEA